MAADPATQKWSPTLGPWLDVLRVVPRHLFIPERVYVPNVDGVRPPLVRLHRDDDPQRWLSLAYGAETPGWVVTQVDDGHAVEDVGGIEPTSSASGPLIVAIMLAALDAQPGERVLEVGTGTGYNAALLAHRLGAGCVTSVEVDPTVAEAARRPLHTTGAGVRVVCDDGTRGYEPGAPYDRLIATVGVRDIPHAWVAQTRPGGRVLVPYRNPFTGALVSLTVEEGGHATGSIVDDASFMWLRQQRPPESDALDDDQPDVERTTTDIHPYWIGGDRGAQFATAQWVPGCQWRYLDEPGGGWAMMLLDFVSRSWAKVVVPDPHADVFPVVQHGPRRLFDESERAYRWWDGHGRPGVERWRFTVGPDGQRIELVP